MTKSSSGLRAGERESDRDLVDRAKGGDADAFGQLVRRHQPRIHRLAVHMLRDRAEAEDVAQETFIRAYQALARFDGRSEPYTWFYRITINLSLNRIRSRKTSRTTHDTDDPRLDGLLADTRPEGADPSTFAQRREMYVALCTGIDQLSDTLRTTLVLVCVDGRSHEDVAAILGAPEGTIAWRIHEARRKLKEFSEDPGIRPRGRRNVRRNVTEKKLDLDAALRAWPEAEKSEQDWEEMAQRTAERARARDEESRIHSVSNEDVLVAPLGQLPEEGHNSAAPARVGDKRGERPMTMADRERDRRSLQDLAKMAAMTPPPASVTPKSGVSRAPTSQPSADDSGIVDLAAAAASDPHASVRSQQTPLASQGLFDDDAVASQRPAALAQQPYPSVPPMPASMPPLSAGPASYTPSAPSVAPMQPISAQLQPKANKKGGSGAVIVLLVGGLVAASAAAAGGFFYVKTRAAHNAATGPVAVTVPATPDVAPAPTAAPANAAPAEQPTIELPSTPNGKIATGPQRGHLAHKPAAAPAAKPPKDEGPPAAFAPPPKAEEPPTPPPAKVAGKDLPKNDGPGGDLNSEMHKAAGDLDKPQPAAATTSGPAPTGNVPQKPSQGAVTGAIGAVLPSARACLGPDDPISRANIVFGSNGSVQSVSVSGAAAGKPAEACIKGALMKAKVTPFAEPTYTANITVRHN